MEIIVKRFVHVIVCVVLVCWCESYVLWSVCPAIGGKHQYIEYISVNSDAELCKVAKQTASVSYFRLLDVKINYACSANLKVTVEFGARTYAQ